MSPILIGSICVIALLILIFTRMWVGYAMLIPGIIGLIAIIGVHKALPVLATQPYIAISNYTFAAIPLFLLMGLVVFNTGFAQDLFNAAYKWIGELGGGLAMACCIASAVLGVVTDSMIAAITLGKCAMPEMKKYHYNEGLAAGSIVAGASLASLIPPSVGFILFGLITGVSIGKLYMGGIIPGILLTMMFILTIYFMVKRKPGLAPPGPKTRFKEKVDSLKYTWAIVLLLIAVVAGIYLGIFTPTEAGAAGAFLAIIIGLIARRLTGKVMFASIKETAEMTGMIVLLVSGAYVFKTLMAISQLPFAMSDLIVSLSLSKYAVIILIIFLYVIIGMFCDIVAAVLITVPIVFPLVTKVGFDPVWFGVLIMMIMELGLITPPVGLNVFQFGTITGVNVGTVFKGLVPFFLSICLFIIVITIFPQIVTVLPNTM